MAVNISRSMHGGLLSGATDGKYRKARPDTEVANDHGDAATERDRQTLHPWYNYGYVTNEFTESQQIVPGYGIR